MSQFHGPPCSCALSAQLNIVVAETGAIRLAVGDDECCPSALVPADCRDRRVSFARSLLEGATLRANVLDDVNLDSAIFLDADLRNATLASPQLRDSDLTDARMSGARISGGRLSGVNLTGADLRGGELSSVEMMDTYAARINEQGRRVRGAECADRLNEGDRFTPESELKLDFSQLVGLSLNERNVWCGASLRQAHLSGLSSGATLT